MKKHVVYWLLFILAYIIFSIIHEGSHAILASIFNEYSSFKILPYGFEVTYKTLVVDRSGLKWAVISGIPNLITLFIGYILFLNRKSFLNSRSEIKYLLLYIVILFMIGDPFNLSIGPFIWGGDIFGITTGLSINQFVVQAIFFIILIINRELIAQKLLPDFSIKTKHILLRKWL
ncbi:MAG: hypothetical protein AB1432_11085 [Bacteroidota bacterium]